LAILHLCYWYVGEVMQVSTTSLLHETATGMQDGSLLLELPTAEKL
jgi:hypothetical protein